MDGRVSARRRRPIIIESIAFTDSRLDEYRRIDAAEHYRECGLFVAEGRLVVRRAVAAGYCLRSLLVSPAARRALEPTIDALPSRTPVYVCEPEDVRRISGFNIHRGCLAIVERPAAREFPALIAAARLVVVLEAVANPDNVGGIFRNAAAFGADAVILSPTAADPLYRKAIRTSMAASLHVPFARAESWPDDIVRLT